MLAAIFGRPQDSVPSNWRVVDHGDPVNWVRGARVTPGGDIINPTENARILGGIASPHEWAEMERDAMGGDTI